MLLHILAVLIIIAVVVVIAESIYDNSHFVVRRYELASDKVSRDIRICLLTDLHGNSYGNDNEKLIKAIYEQSPDIVIAAGDMISSYSDTKRSGENNALSLMRTLAGRYKVFCSNGNHEYKWKKLTDEFGDTYKKYAEELRKSGVILLENESYYDKDLNIRITGLEIQHYYYKKLFKRKMTSEYIDQLVGKSTACSTCENLDKIDNGVQDITSDKKEPYQILSAHNPVYFDSYAAWGADLTVSGHVHGGIVRLPVLGGVISPALSLFPKYDGGRFDTGESTMILSRGLGTHTIPVRVFNPGELVIIDIKKNNPTG